jgi:hypothetical protein
MNCPYCGHILINAVSTNDEKLILVESPPFYGPTYGHPGDTVIDGVPYEIVRPLPRSLVLHSAVCNAETFL